MGNCVPFTYSKRDILIGKEEKRLSVKFVIQ